MLIGFLKDILETKDSVNILNDDIISHKGMKYEDPDSLILAGFVSSDKHRDYFSCWRSQGLSYACLSKDGGGEHYQKH